jgi:hypothetical protein
MEPAYLPDTCQGRRRKFGDVMANGGISFGETADEWLYTLAIFGGSAFVIFMIVIIVTAIAGSV